MLLDKYRVRQQLTQKVESVFRHHHVRHHFLSQIVCFLACLTFKQVPQLSSYTSDCMRIQQCKYSLRHMKENCTKGLLEDFWRQLYNSSTNDRTHMMMRPLIIIKHFSEGISTCFIKDISLFKLCEIRDIFHE